MWLGWVSIIFESLKMSYRRLIHTCLKLYPFTTWFRDLIYFLTKLVELVSLIRIDSLPYSNNKLCLTSSFFSSEPYLNGSLCGETILFLFWIYLNFVIFVLDLLPHVYSLCAWVYLFYYQWILITYQKKKNNNVTSTLVEQDDNPPLYAWWWSIHETQE